MRHLVFHNGELTVSSKGATIKLLPKEFELPEFFSRHPNQIFTRTDLIYAVWQWSDSYERTVDDHVYRLRRKFAGWKHIELQTVRGRGYRLVWNDSEEKENPLTQDRQFQAGMDMFFSLRW